MEKIRYLERAIQSLHSQGGVSVKPIVVLQRFAEAEVEEVRRMLSRNWYFPEHQPCSLLNLDDGEAFDARSRLLNIGLTCHAATDNAYLGFLDHDDFLYSHAYEVLARSLEEKSVAIAFAGIELGNAVALDDYDFIYDMSKPFAGRNKIDLMRDNFCPIHSYLLKTSEIDPKLLFFREDMCRVEDYEFLIRVAGASPCDFSNLDTSIGCYVVRADGSNTTPFITGSADSELKAIEWARNVRLLNGYKSSTEVKLFASDF